MDLDEAGFHPTVLVRFRERLLERGQEGVGFEAGLTVLRQAGYLPKKAPQRLDSTHVLAQVARSLCERDAASQCHRGEN